jgi:hypothetical protein
MIVIEVRLPRLRPRLKTLLEDSQIHYLTIFFRVKIKTVTNLPYTVKSNHRVKNLFHSLGFIPKPTNLPYKVKSNHPVKNLFHYLGFIPKP